jgi:hypothetical protein
VLFSTVGGGGGTGTATLSHLVSSSQFVLRSETAGGHEWYVGGSERARIDSSGRLLVGTSTALSNVSIAGTLAAPTFQIQGATGSAAGAVLTRTTAGSAFLTLNAGSSGNNVASGNGIGALQFNGFDGTNYVNGASISAAVDGTPGANDMPGRLVFSTTADGASSPTERMRIASNGDVFFRETTTAAITNGTGSGRYIAGANGAMYSSRATTATADHITFYNSNGNVGSITTSGSATTYATSSDYRLKENVVPLTGAIDRLQQIPVHRFNFIADPDTVVDGFIAHEAQAIVPECVTGTKDEVDEDGNPVYQGIDQSKLVPLLTAALQEAIAEIASLKDRVAALEAS